MSKLVLLLQKDFRVIYRDGFMPILFVYPALMAVALRAGAPLIPVEHIELYLAPAVALFGGPLLGTILGYALIEEREQNTWLLLRVLPVSQLGLFGYVGAVSGAITIVMTLLAAAIYGLPIAEPARFAWMVLASAPTTLLVMLILGAATANKVEGLALAKLVSASGIAPALVFVLPQAWQFLLWWHPFYWIYLGFLSAYAGDATLASLPLHWPGYPFWTFALAPVALSLAGIVELARVYRRRAQ